MDIFDEDPYEPRQFGHCDRESYLLPPWDSVADQVSCGMPYRYTFLYRQQQEGVCVLPLDGDGWVAHRIPCENGSLY